MLGVAEGVWLVDDGVMEATGYIIGIVLDECVGVR